MKKMNSGSHGKDWYYVNSSRIIENATWAVTNQTPIADDQEIPKDIAIAGAIIGIVIIATGAFGNILVILAVWLSKPLYKYSNLFVVSLAVCDLFQTLMVRPLYIHTYVIRKWMFGSNVCLYALFASNIAILENILHVCAIAFHRYVIMVHPKFGNKFQSLRSVVLMLVVIYVFPLTLTLLGCIPYFTKLGDSDTQIVFNKRLMFCSFTKHTDFRLSGVLKKLGFLTAAALFLLYCYCRIYQCVRKSGKSIDTQGSFSPTRIQRELSLLKTVVVVFSSFLLTYLPLSILYGVDRRRDLPYGVYLIGVVLLWLSSSINWMIYGMMNKQYLNAYKHILCRAPVNSTRWVTENGSTSRVGDAHPAETCSLRRPRESSKVYKCKAFRSDSNQDQYNIT